MSTRADNLDSVPDLDPLATAHLGALVEDVCADRLPVAALTPVGAQEIADRLAVQVGTVYQWQQREVLPPPWWKVSGRPAWPWAVILEWARETGRMLIVTDGEWRSFRRREEGEGPIVRHTLDDGGVTYRPTGRFVTREDGAVGEVWERAT